VRTGITAQKKCREWGADGKQSGGDGEDRNMQGWAQDLWGGDDLHPMQVCSNDSLTEP